jgi:transcriptional regulator with XRE-family HTH domain
MDNMSMIQEVASDLNRLIAARVRQLRAGRKLSLDALAAKSGVSRSMISLVERGESSPTAAVLARLAAGLGVTLSSLFDRPADVDRTPDGPLARRQDQPTWQDPASGYVRRNVSPRGVPQPVQIVEVLFPPRASVAFENTGHAALVYQQVWVLEGTMDVALGDQRHRLREGDCLAMQLDRLTMFHNPTRKPARYVVVTATENSTKR